MISIGISLGLGFYIFIATATDIRLPVLMSFVISFIVAAITFISIGAIIGEFTFAISLIMFGIILFIAWSLARKYKNHIKASFAGKFSIVTVWVVSTIAATITGITTAIVHDALVIPINALFGIPVFLGTFWITGIMVGMVMDDTDNQAAQASSSGKNL